MLACLNDEHELMGDEGKGKVGALSTVTKRSGVSQERPNLLQAATKIFV